MNSERAFAVTTTILVLLMTATYGICSLEPQRASGALVEELNPAIVYSRAFSKAPSPDQIGDAERELWLSSGGQLNETARRLARRFDDSFRFLHRAAALDGECDWMVDFSQGAATPLPHLTHGLDLARICSWRVRLHIEEGREDEALNDILSVLYLGRRAGADGSLIGGLVGYRIEREAIMSAAEQLGAFTGEALRELETRLVLLPSRVRSSQLLLADRDLLYNDAGYYENVAGFLDVKERAEAIANRTGYLEHLSGVLDTLVELMDLKYDQFLAEREELREDIRSLGGPIINDLFIPAYANVRFREFRVASEFEMLRAAIKYRLEGTEGFVQIKDPYNGGPFQVNHPAGFEVTVISNYSGSAADETAQRERITLRFRLRHLVR